MDISNTGCPSCKKQVEFPSHFKYINCPYCGDMLEIKISGKDVTLSLMAEKVVTPVIIESYKGVFSLRVTPKTQPLKRDEKSGEDVLSAGQRDASSSEKDEFWERRKKVLTSLDKLDAELIKKELKEKASAKEASFVPSNISKEHFITKDYEVKADESFDTEPSSNLSDVTGESFIIKDSESRVEEEAESIDLHVHEAEIIDGTKDNRPKDDAPSSEKIELEEKTRSLEAEDNLMAKPPVDFTKWILPVLVGFCLIISLVLILNKSGNNSSNNTFTATPSPEFAFTEKPELSPVAMLYPSPVSEATEIPEEGPSPSPETEISPTEVPTPYPTFAPRPTIVPVPTATMLPPTEVPVKPTAIPTIAYNPPPVNNGGYSYDDDYREPTPVPTEVSYADFKRTYCNEYIKNKIMPLYNDRRYDEAIQECHHIISTDKNYYVNYLWMANCLLSYRAVEDAKYYIDMAWKLEYNETRVDYGNSQSKKLYDRYYEMGGN